MLPALKFLVGAQVRITVVQVGNQAQVDLVVFSVVQKGAASRAVLAKGPAQAVLDETFLVFIRRDLPYFLDANAVVLWVLTLIQAELADQFFPQVSAAAFRKKRVFRVQLHAGRVAVFVFAGGADAHIASCDAFYPTVIVVKDFRGGKPRVHFYAQFFSLFRKPTTHVTHGHDVIAVIVGRLGDQEPGEG